MRFMECFRTCSTRCSPARRCRGTSSSIRRSTTRCGRASPSSWRTSRGTTRPARPCRRTLLNKVLAAQKFDQGYATTEYLAAALLDQAWHRITAEQAPARCRCGRLRGGRAAHERNRLRGCAAEVSLDVFLAHLRRRLFRRVLRLSVERGVGSRHRAMDARSWRNDTRQRRLAAARRCCRGGVAEDPQTHVPKFLRRTA